MTGASWEQKVIRHFDGSAPFYGDSYRGDSAGSHFFQTRQKIIMSLLSNLSGGALLDIGCGPGLMAEPCGNQGFTYCGIDISERMIAECRHRPGKPQSASFLVGKMQGLPFTDNYFDVLLCMGALEYVPAAEETVARMEMLRVVKPGGLLIISHLNRLSPYWLWQRFVYQQIRACVRLARTCTRQASSRDAREVPIREFTERSSRQMLKVHDAVVTRKLYYGFNIFLPPFDNRFPRLALWTSSKLEGLCNGALGRLAMAFIIVAKKAPG
jgi:ubiquinone/menaquinone biosynthesis C-methylase UbiE